MRNLEKRDGINLYLCPMCKGVITCLRLVAGYPTPYFKCMRRSCNNFNVVMCLIDGKLMKKRIEER